MLVTQLMGNPQASDNRWNLHRLLLIRPVLSCDAHHCAVHKLSLFKVIGICFGYASSKNLDEGHAKMFCKFTFQKAIDQLLPDFISLSPRHCNQPLSSGDIMFFGQFDESFSKNNKINNNFSVFLFLIFLLTNKTLNHYLFIFLSFTFSIMYTFTQSFIVNNAYSDNCCVFNSSKSSCISGFLLNIFLYSLSCLSSDSRLRKTKT